MKKILYLMLGIATMLPIQEVLASTYYDQKEQLMIEFPEKWYEFSDEMYQQIADVSGKAFMKQNGGAELYLNEVEEDNKNAETIRNLAQHLKTTEKELQKPERYINTLQTSFGMDIRNYQFNSDYTKIKLEMVQTSKNFGEINVTGYWVFSDKKVYEMKFYQFEYTKKLNEEIQYIIDSVKFDDEIYSQATNDIKQGQFSADKVVSQDDQSNTVLGKLWNFLNDNTVWWVVLGTIILYLLGAIVYRLA